MKRAALVLAVCLAAALPAAAGDRFDNFKLSGNASPGVPAPNTPLGPTNSLEATTGYTLDTHDAAMVTVSMTGVSYASSPVKITKGAGTVKVRFSALCKPGTPATQTVKEVVLKMWDAHQKEITSATSPQKVSLTFTCPAAKPNVPK